MRLTHERRVGRNTRRSRVFFPTSWVQWNGQWNSAELWLIKTRKFFHMTSRKQTVQGECFINERQSNSPKYKDRSGWQRRDTRLQWLMWPSTQRIGKDIRASFYFFTRRAANVVSEACFTVMTGDRHDERAAMDFSMIIFAQTPSWLVWILTVMPVWLYFSSFLFCSVLFLITKL